MTQGRSRREAIKLALSAVATNSQMLSAGASVSDVQLTEPTTSTGFTTLAGVDDVYNVIVPLNLPGYNYAQMSLEPYDPISSLVTGAPTIINLSTLTATTPLNAGPITGTCTDTDAPSPDQDDPDCD